MTNSFSREIYLASGSPRRLELMEQIGLLPKVISVDVDESVLLNESPEFYVKRLAKHKAEVGLNGLNQNSALVVGGDTSIVFRGEIIGKPNDKSDAISILSKLSGEEHEVLSSVAVASHVGCDVRLNKTIVKFKALSVEEIESYVNTKESFGKAGAYAIQGYAASFIENINGSYSGVMGLPLFELNELLAKYKIK